MQVILLSVMQPWKPHCATSRGGNKDLTLSRSVKVTVWGDHMGWELGPSLETQSAPLTPGLLSSSYLTSSQQPLLREASVTFLAG